VREVRPGWTLNSLSRVEPNWAAAALGLNGPFQLAQKVFAGRAAPPGD
jgi:hypothetical protein